jgi:hypothetical protein
MAFSDILKGIDLASQRGCQIDLEGEKSADLVEAAEMVLGVVFPPSYREFLLLFGCGGIAGHEFYGVINSDFVNSGIPDAVWLTMRERVDSNLPARFVIVGAQGDGAYYALDGGRIAQDKERPVIIWWPGVSQEECANEVETLAPDFGTFFLNKIESTL